MTGAPGPAIPPALAAQLAAINATLAAVQGHVGALQGQVGALQQQSLRSLNSRRGNGLQQPWAAVPDLAGALPPPSAIDTVAVVDGFTVAQLNQRLAFYGLPLVGTALAKGTRLRDFLCGT